MPPHCYEPAVNAAMQVNALLSSELRLTQSGGHVAKKLLEVCTQLYHLCSTTVTGIPMKVQYVWHCLPPPPRIKKSILCPCLVHDVHILVCNAHYYL